MSGGPGKTGDLSCGKVADFAGKRKGGVWGIHVMKSILKVAVFSIIALCTTLIAEGQVVRYRPGELLLKMIPGHGVGVIIATYGVSIRGQLPQTGCFLMNAPEGQNAESLAVIIDARDDVDYCTVNHNLAAPEPFQRSQPFLDVECVGDIYAQTSATTLNLAAAHLISTGENVRVAVIDGGVNFNHPVFIPGPGEVVSGWDYIDGDADAFDETGGVCHGHGTFAAGIIRMTAPAADIYSYRVLDTMAIGSAYAISEAVLQAMVDSCRIINLSLGMVGFDPALDEVLNLALENNILIVAAAGNDSLDFNSVFQFPASRASCMAVAALDSMNLKADFSNYGNKIDICAPGTQIYAAFPDTGYAWWNGTSFAAPFIAGTAAMMLALEPALSRDNIFNIIRQTAINVDDINPDYAGLLGSGLVNVSVAVSLTDSIASGDANGDGIIDLLDILFIIDFIYRAGPSPEPTSLADVNGDGLINLIDILLLIGNLY